MNDIPAEPGTVDLHRFREIILRRKSIVFLAFAGVTLSSLTGSWLMTPVYEATATLQIDEKELSFGSGLLKPIDAFMGSKASLIESEVEIIKSRTIAEMVVRKLDLDKRIDDIPNDVAVSMTPITTDGTAKLGAYKLVLRDDRGGYSVFDNAGQLVGDGEAGQRFESGGISFTVSDVQARQGDVIRFSLLDFQSAVATLRANTAVAPIRTTNVVNLSVKGRSPVRVAATVNAIADAYAQQSLSRRTGQAFSTAKFLEQQLAKLEEELQRSERAVEEYKIKSGVVTLGDEVQASLRQITEIELERATVEAELREVQSVTSALDSDIATPDGRLIISTSGIKNLPINELSRQLTNLEVQRSSLEGVFTTKHPTVIANQAKIDETTRRLVSELEAAAVALKERMSALTEVAERFEENLRDLPEVELNLAGLLRTSTVNEGIHAFLLQRYEEARMVEAAELGNVHIIDSAIPPRRAIRPRTRLNTIFGAILGMMLGIGMAFLLESLDNSIKTAEDAEKALGIPVFGVIPRLDGHQNGRRGSRLHPAASSASTGLIVAANPGLLAIEAYRSLRTNIQYAEPDRSAKTVLITSAVPKEGKTTTVINLAIALAHTETRVLLVGADLRRPEVHTIFGIPRQPGLCEILTGKIDWHAAVRPSGYDKLALIPSGKIPPNPTDILASERLIPFLQAVKLEFDVVLFDSPPVLGFADAPILANRLDATFIVVRAGATTAQMAARVKATLENVHGKVVGTILNMVSVETEGYGYGYYLNSDYHERYRAS